MLGKEAPSKSLNDTGWSLQVPATEPPDQGSELDLGRSQATRRIWLLGSLRLEGAQGPIQISSRRAQSLLAYLALHGDTLHPREVLADRLWPEDSPERIGRNLADTLYRLRQSLGPGWLRVERDRIGLLFGADLWMDAWEFERLSAASDPPSLQRAIALYKGDLLPEIYDDWILPLRVSWHERYLTSLLKLGRIAERHNQPEVAFEYYHRLSNSDPLREEAHRGIMRNLAQMGRHRQALDAYARLERLMEDELSVAPSVESRALAETLRRELELVTDVEARKRSGRARPTFVGRVVERAQLLSLLGRARAGRGSLVVLLGEAGMGKTRLLDTLAQSASWRGWQVAKGEGEEFSLPQPYAPLRQALTAALPQPRLRQVSQLVPSVWLALSTSVVPPLEEVVSDREQLSSLGAQDRLPLALHQLLHGLQQIGPHLFILDDVQWADPAAWPLLDSLRQALAEMAVLLVVSGRTSELRADAIAGPTLDEWDRQGVPLIYLEGLSADELHELALSQGTTELSPTQLSQLETATGGNPLLALSILQQGRLGQVQGKPILDQLALDRLDMLSAPAAHALQAAAVIGYRFNYLVWEAVIERRGLTAEMLPGLAGELERAGFIELDAEQYRFPHDTLRASVYANTEEPDRGQLHADVLDVLRQRGDADPLTLLSHAQQANAREAVAEYALQAGERALKSFAFQPAVAYFSEALSALPLDDVAKRYAAVLGRVRAWEVLAERNAQREDLSLLQTLAGQLGDVALRTETSLHRARFHLATGAFDQAHRIARDALALFPQVEQSGTRAALLEVLGLVERERNDYARAQGWIQQAQEVYRHLGSRFGEASTAHLIGSLDVLMGDYRSAVEPLSRAADLFHQIGQTPQEVVVLNMLGRAFLGIGDYSQAKATHERALSIASQLGDKRGQLVNTGNLARIAVDLGDYAQGIELYDKVLAISRETNDSVGLATTLGNLGEAYRQLGDHDQALKYFDEALSGNRSIGRRRGEGYALHSRGLIFLEQDRLHEARSALETARTMRLELGERDNLLENHAALALVYLATGEIELAQASLQAALQELDPNHDREYLRQWVHFVAYRVFHTLGDLSVASQHILQAQQAMLQAAASMSPEDRSRFLQGVPLNRETAAALDGLSHRVQVRLVRSDVPLGRTLNEADYIDVTWTVSSPEDDMIQRKGRRRRHVLQRLVAEAAAQGATPSDGDLAKALGVSRRTILRDMDLLAQSSVVLPTRRRKSQT